MTSQSRSKRALMLLCARSPGACDDVRAPGPRCAAPFRLPECCDAGLRRLIALTGVLRLHPEHRVERIHLVDRFSWLHPVHRLRRLDPVGGISRLAGLGVFDRLSRQRRLDLVSSVPLVHPGVAVPRACSASTPPAISTRRLRLTQMWVAKAAASAVTRPSSIARTTRSLIGVRICRG